MEIRTVGVTLEQAREWYRGDNEALKTIALKCIQGLGT